MRDKRGILGLISGSAGVILAYVVDAAWRFNDGIDGTISPFLAQVLSYLPIEGPPQGFTNSTGFQITEDGAIWFVGGVAVLLGVVGVILSFLSIKRREDVRISFAALSVGSAPVIMFSLSAGIIVFLGVGLTAVFYQHHLTRG